MPPSPKMVTNRPAPKTRPSPQEGEDGWGLGDGLKVLLYGESGTGKTTFWSTFPGPTLCLICSGGKNPGELRSIDTPEMRRKVTARRVLSFDQFNEAVKDGRDFATVVLDHASGFSDLLLSEIIGKPVPEQKGWGLASQQEYGQLGMRCKEGFRRLLDLPGNVVIVAQQRVFGGKDDGGNPDLIAPTVGAALTPSVVGWLNPACDYVVQTFKRGEVRKKVRKVGDKEVTTEERTGRVEYCLRCSPHEVFMTKFRKPGGIDGELILVNPTYRSMLEAINA